MASPTREVVRARPGLPRMVDAGLALLALVLLTPILLLVALAVRLSSPGPVLFRQQRIGQFGRPFMFVKFRSMVPRAEGIGVTAADDPRITSVGRWLRRFKLDELPQLWNVAVGDMALVGPRPEVPRYVDNSDPRWAEVLAARPGLTDPVTLQLRNEEGLLAAGGRDAEEFYRRVLQPWKLDGYIAYLRQRTPASDMRVLLGTGRALLLPWTTRAPEAVRQLVARPDPAPPRSPKS